MIEFIRQKLRSNLGKDIFVTLLSQLGIMVLALFINKLLSVFLGVEGYGQYSIIKKSSSVLSFVMLGGMGIALPRYFSGFLGKNDTVGAKSTVVASLLMVAAVSTVLLTALVLLKSNLSVYISGNNDIGLFLSTLLFAFSITLSSWLFAFYRGGGAFVQFAVSQIAIQFALAITALVFGHNLFHLLNVWSACSIAYVLIAMLIEFRKNTLFTKKNISWKGQVIAHFKTLLRYGAPRLLGDFFLFSFAALPLIFINQKNGIAQSSYFAAGITLTALITPFFSFLGMVLLPHVSTSIAQNRFSEAEKLIKQLSILYIILATVATIVLWFGMEFFIRLFFSSEFIPAAPFAKLLMLSILFESVYLLLRNPIDAVSNFPYNSVNLFFSLALLSILFYFSSNLNQYAISYVIATAIRSAITLITWHYCRKKQRLNNLQIS